MEIDFLMDSLGSYKNYFFITIKRHLITFNFTFLLKLLNCIF